MNKWATKIYFVAPDELIGDKKIYCVAPDESMGDKNIFCSLR